jgi:hypothetical protein
LLKAIGVNITMATKSRAKAIKRGGIFSLSANRMMIAADAIEATAVNIAI